MSLGGFFSLAGPQDLLKKAEHDLGRLRENPISSFAAFDFFTTVRHLPDWIHPTDAAARKLLFDRHVELRIARHLADGAKHLVLTHSQHKQVAGNTSSQPAFQRGTFQDDAFQCGSLVVKLDPRDPDTASLGTEVDVLELAERVLKIARGIVV